jgi:hypothetical protein
MRLSHAILLGSTILSPCKGSRKWFENEGDNGCALEMALEAVGRKGAAWQRASDVWNWLNDKSSSIKWGETRLMEIACKFDIWVMTEASMTLEQFIEHVRSIEPAEPTESAESVEIVDVLVHH